MIVHLLSFINNACLMFFLQFKSRSGSRRDIEYVSGSTALNISIDKLFLLSTNWSQKVFFLHPGGNPAF